MNIRPNTNSPYFINAMPSSPVLEDHAKHGYIDVGVFIGWDLCHL